MSPLDQKLLRDLWRIKGQALAIAAVIAVGVLLLVMMSGLVNSLEETRRAYYERYRLADVFAPVKRAPQHLARRIAAIDGVRNIETRVSGQALIDLPGIDLPIRSKLVSIPDNRPSRLNDLYLSAGRKPSSDHPEEVLLLHSFANAHQLRPGDTLRITLNGTRYQMRIVGLAEAPEFLYTTAPGELMSDDARYGVIWMGLSALASAYDLDGAFNEALLSLERNAQLPAVINAVDRLLEPYGGFGAYGLEDQTSNRFVTEEIAGLRGTGAAVPPIFLSVAAFLLYIVISRMVESERGQIGLIKAFGYTNLETSVHYFKLIIVIAAGGALMGCFVGILAGRALVDVYLLYFKFPFLIFRLDAATFVIGFSTSVLAASAGGLFVLRRVFELTPATAMRPPVPVDYSRSLRTSQRLHQLLDQPTRMVLRRITRQPMRMLGASVGIAAGMALSVAMIGTMNGFDETIERTFNRIDHSDITVTFNEPLAKSAVFDLQQIPGVIEVQAVRNVSVVLKNGRNEHLGALTGLPDNTRLYRALDSRMKSIEPPKNGIVLAASLAGILGVKPGDALTVDVREGRRPSLTIPVTGVAETLLGAPAYMDMAALNRELKEPHRISAAYLRIDSAEKNAIYAALKNMPAVAGASLKDDARAALQKQMDSGAGAMRYIMALVAGIITFGIVYNAARIAQAERARDLASLRVMGFTRGEAAFVLLGEIAVVTLLAIPLGALGGHYLSFAVAKGFSTDLYQIPVIFSPSSYGTAATAILCAALLSGWLVKRDIDKTDLVAALKTRE